MRSYFALGYVGGESDWTIMEILPYKDTVSHFFLVASLLRIESRENRFELERDDTSGTLEWGEVRKLLLEDLPCSFNLTSKKCIEKRSNYLNWRSRTKPLILLSCLNAVRSNQECFDSNIMFCDRVHCKFVENQSYWMMKCSCILQRFYNDLRFLWLRGILNSDMWVFVVWFSYFECWFLALRK